MALQHLRSSTANKRPLPAGMSDGQLAINTNLASPGVFFKDSNGDLVKVGPVHVGTTAPNASPAAGGQTGNTVGEQWLDTTGGGYVFKVWDGSAWRSETGEFVNVNGDTMTGDLVMNNANIVFEGATADDFETTLTVTDPTADRTITLPDQTGNVLVSGNASIVDADVNASAAIAGTKISPDFGAQNVTTTGTSTAASFIPTSSTVPTNGLYLPDANSVALSVNGSEGARLTTTGLGIGTSVPSSLLELFSGGDATLTLTGNLASGSNVSSVDFKRNGGTVNASVQSVSSGSNDAGALYFSTRPNAGSLTERLRITPTGLVGIGSTTVSNAMLQVTSGVAGAAIKSEDTGSTGSFLRILGDASSGNLINWKTGTVLRFATSDDNYGSFSERFRCDSSGRLLVGTSSDFKSIPFQVRGSAAIGYAANDAFSEGLFFTKTRGSSPATQTIVQSGDVLGVTIFQGSDGTAYRTAATIQAEVDGTPGTNDMPGRLTFSTTADGASSPTERMRITSGGFLKATNTGTYNASTAPYHELNSDQGSGGIIAMFENTSSTGSGLQIRANSSNTSYWYLLGFSTSASLARFIVYTNGDVQNATGSYTAFSDLKLKENIVPAPSQWDDIKALPVRKYNLKEELGFEPFTQIGLIAQEIEDICPGLVMETPDRDEEGNDLGTTTKGVKYSILYMKAVKALQEAMERIETLEQRLNDAGIN